MFNAIPNQGQVPNQLPGLPGQQTPAAANEGLTIIDEFGLQLSVDFQSQLSQVQGAQNAGDVLGLADEYLKQYQAGNDDGMTAAHTQMQGLLPLADVDFPAFEGRVRNIIEKFKFDLSLQYNSETQVADNGEITQQTQHLQLNISIQATRVQQWVAMLPPKFPTQPLLGEIQELIDTTSQIGSEPIAENDVDVDDVDASEETDSEENDA